MDDPKRITPSRANRAMHDLTCVLRQSPRFHDAFLESTIEEIRYAVANYTMDRSCHSCVHNREGLCTKWGQPIPFDSLDDGCKAWQDLPLPFPE